MQFFAAAALTAALVTSQFSFATVLGDSSATVQTSKLIPDNVTIDQPVPLSEISLPKNDYGTLSWVDDSSVPSARTQVYDVVFRPYNTADLAQIPGWDGQSDVIYSTVTVVVSSISKDSDHSGSTEQSDEMDNTEAEVTETPETDENTENSEVTEEISDNEKMNNTPENPEITETPDVPEDPEITETPDTPETPEVTEIPEITGTPDLTETPETPDMPETPEITETPDMSETPEVSENPEITETPDLTETPETPDETEVPETPENPDVTETPDMPETPEVTEIPEITVTPEADKDNIFDGTEKDITKDDREHSVEETAEPSDEEKEQLAEINHTCNGISVSGINLPWYVQFRVASGENYEFTNAAEANVFKSYEFELWDMKNNTEYEIPDGEYLSVTVPVKAGYDYTIEHILDSGAVETIVPSVEGSTMVFSTHSFSPFGIAGSKTLVGEEIEDGSYSSGTGSTSAVSITPTASVTTASGAANTNNSASADNTAAQNSASGNQDNSTVTSEKSETDSSSNSVGAVETGDNTPILPFVIIGIAAAVIVAVLVYLKKKR